MLFWFCIITYDSLVTICLISEFLHLYEASNLVNFLLHNSLCSHHILISHHRLLGKNSILLRWVNWFTPLSLRLGSNWSFLVKYLLFEAFKFLNVYKSIHLFWHCIISFLVSLIWFASNEFTLQVLYFQQRVYISIKYPVILLNYFFCWLNSIFFLLIHTFLVYSLLGRTFRIFIRNMITHFLDHLWSSWT